MGRSCGWPKSDCWLSEWLRLRNKVRKFLKGLLILEDVKLEVVIERYRDVGTSGGGGGHR